MQYVRPNPPSDDKRYKTLIREMKKHGYKRNSLIQVLHTAQETFGFLEEEVMKFTAESLQLPLSKVYGVATFYHFFNMKPMGENTCIICTGTACYIKGAGEIMAKIEEEFGIPDGETTPDNKLTAMSARCFGCCNLAPAAIMNGETVAYLNPESAIEKIREMIQ